MKMETRGDGGSRVHRVSSVPVLAVMAFLATVARAGDRADPLADPSLAEPATLADSVGGDDSQAGDHVSAGESAGDLTIQVPPEPSSASAPQDAHQVGDAERAGDPAGEGQAVDVDGAFQGHDPNGTELMLAPTGRPLERGQAVIGMHDSAYLGHMYVGAAVGITNNLSLAGGIAATSSEYQGRRFYLEPRFGLRPSRRVAISVGALYVSRSHPRGADVGTALALGTYGGSEGSVTLGLGLEFSRERGQLTLVNKPLVIVGVSKQIGRSTAFVAESWVFPEGGPDLVDQPLGLAMRVFGHRFSADIGVVLIPLYVADGLFSPWLSLSYRLDRHASRSETRRSVHAGPQGALAGRPRGLRR